MSNYLTPFEAWQNKKFGNYYPESEAREETETLISNDLLINVPLEQVAKVEDEI